MPCVEAVDLLVYRFRRSGGRDSGEGKDDQTRYGKLVEGWVHESREKRVFE